MGHSIGDGIVAAALSAAVIGYFYFTNQTRQKRLEILHQERMTAMEKDMALPDLDPPEVYSPPDQSIQLIIGIVLAMFGLGAMIALSLALAEESHRFWVMPLPIALIGVGLIIAYIVTATNNEIPRK